MANLKDIRDRIKSVKSIQKVTKAMKMVAAAKMRRAQERMEHSRPYSNSLTEVIHHLLPDVDRNSLPLLDVREIKRKAYVIVSADRGLAGALNTNLLKVAQKEIDEFGKENVDLFCIGKKARDHFKRREYNIITSHVDFWADMEFDSAMKIGRSIIEHFTSGKVDEIHVVFNYFINVGKQEVKSEILLPLIFEAEDNVAHDRLYEPSKEELVSSLIPRHLNVQMWKYLLESYASEQAARMLAMENATTNAEDMIKDLTLQFNKARQAAITTEMLEIVGGAEALG
ncbi:MAG: ATP synthase F1 subunit gamma [Candidatus Marinimicrobia bacterium]|jgi:F-type H+-transporting ATPase subunit gamma|nr:ATP synthase F1 subunit gamma [Candidatus Neomarinimicrobiota bacterium]MBT3500867.1 ATP synthase F1 subunit gamma [Candidatus Neomarinimicrobiota bacterium]MBT3838901.1 ATP synthase F1 subunit gamma [Candidatus Neomarinimicrobiota bacterium]MBT4000326.1 ATP synthase F1 subunit gamma [Candidatus Neomarinimicrobiota bacterium]MBT4282803.1 ATP synthase F1 subunit gamma [Candidatus Neomarinimicrobiota bacterium]